jgi:manganese oxidase
MKLGTLKLIVWVSGLSALFSAGCSQAPAMTTSGTSQAPTSAATTHTYYIAADEVTWDFAPSNMNGVSGKPFGDEEKFWIERGPHKIGKVFKKALYREYLCG